MAASDQSAQYFTRRLTGPGASAPADSSEGYFTTRLTQPSEPAFAADIPRPASLAEDSRGPVDRITSDFTPIIDEAARAHGLDPRLMKGIMLTESSGNPNAVSKSGAAGLFQLMPIAVEEVNRQFGTNYTPEDRFDPAKSADMGAKYFGLQLKKAGGDPELALRYYNGGYNRARWGKENAAYAGRVFGNMDEDQAHPENQSVDSRYAFDVLDNAMRFNAPDRSDFGRSFKSALGSAYEDATSGMSGYLQSLMGDTAGAERNYAALKAQQQEAADLAKPQDQWSGVQRLSELDDYLASNAGNALGSMAGPLAGAATGAAIGSVIPGVGTALGGIVGGALPLAAQYIGNTWGGAVDQNTKAGATPVQAIDALDAGDLTRIGGYGLARGAVEGAADVALGGLGGGLIKLGSKILPKGMGGGAVDLLSKGITNPIDRIGTGMVTEGLTEAADVPLEAAGTGRPLSDIRPQEVADATMGGMFGGGGMVAGGQAMTNPRGLAAATRGQLPGGAQYRPDYGQFAQNQQAYGPVPSERQYNRDYYDRRGWRDATRAGEPSLNTEGTLYDGARISAEAERLAMQQAEAQQREAQRIPSVKEIFDQMTAEYNALVEQNKPKKVTEDDYIAERDAHLEQDPEGMDIPPQLQSFDAYKKFHKEDAKAKAKAQPKRVAPTLSDAAKQRQQIIQDRFANPQDMVGPRDNPDMRMGPDRSTQPPKLLPPPPIPRGPRSLNPLPRGPQQTDMFGGGGTVIPLGPLQEESVVDEVDPNQLTLDDAAAEQNQLAVRKRDAAVFNRAAREEAKQKARDEAVAADVTRPRNTAMFVAQDQVAEQDVPAETAPDIGQARRQVRALNKAELAAERKRQEADSAKQTALETRKAELRKEGAQIEDGDELQWTDGEGWNLYPADMKTGRKNRNGTFFAKVYNEAGDVIGKVKRQPQPTTGASNETTRAIPEEVQGREGNPGPAQASRQGGDGRVQESAEAEVGPSPDQIIADKLAEQEKLLAEKDAQKAKPKTRKVKTKAEKKAAPTVDDLISKIESVEMKPKATEKRKATAAEQKQLEQDMLGAAADDYASVDRTDNLNELDFDNLDSDYEGDTEFFSVKPGKPARGVRRSVADTAVAPLKSLAQNLGVEIKVYDNAQQALGPNAQIPKGTKGAYWPKSRIIGVFADAADSVQDIETTLAHEIFGHFGLNTFTPAEKRALLTRIAKSKDLKGLKEAFAEVARDQPDLVGDDLMMAEEVFARVAESPDSALHKRAWDQIRAFLLPVLRKLGLAKGQISEAELRVIAQRIADGIRKGKVRQQTFPANDQAQFRNEFNDHLDKVYPELRTSWGQGADMVKNLIVQFNGIPQLAKWMPHLKSLQTIHAGEKAMSAAQNEMTEETLAIVDRMRELSEPEQKTLSRLMLDATLERAHPDVDFTDDANSHLKNDPAAELAHARLQSTYNGLSKDAKKVYTDTRDLFQSMLKRRKEALVALAKELSGSAEAERTKKALDALSKQMPGPYFPLMRFGDHIAVWKSKEYGEAEEANDNAEMERLKQDPQHYLVSFEKSDADAKRQVKEWIDQNGVDRTDTAKSRVLARSDFNGGVNQSLTPLLSKMESALDTTLGKEGKSDEAKNAIREVFLSALPDNSIFKSAIKRRNVRGVKAGEMMRAIASHGGAQAFHISRLEHSHQIQKGLVDLRSEDAAATNEGRQMTSIHSTLARAIGGLYTQDPTTVGTQVAGALTTSIYYNRLALNPAFWVTSFMSPAMVSVPYMKGRHGILSAYRAWSKAATDAARIVTAKHLTRFSFHDQIAENKNITEGERDMLLAVEKAGGIDQTALRELNNVARDDRFDDLKRVLGTVAHRVEVISRISTALAAYRLELKRTRDEDAATRYAVEVVDNTLINYTDAHTPLILRKGGALSGPVAKVVFQFARYQVGMGNLIGHNFREAWVSKTVDDKTRAEARKKFAALLSIHALATGAGGAFGYSFLVGAANMVMGMMNPDDEPADVEKKARKILDDLSVEMSGNKNLSIALRKGLPAAMGFDISARMGMADMLSPRRENPFKGDRAEMAAGIVGAVPGMSHLLDWVSWAKDPTLKTLPVSMVSNLAKTYELMNKGMLNKHGIVKKGPEDFDAVDLMLQGMGFPPTELTEAYANQASARNLDKSIMGARQKLMDRWNNAMNDGDQKAVADARKEIQEFNSRHRGQQDVLISPNTLTKSRKQRMERERRMNSEGVYIPKKGAWRKDYFTDEASQ